MVRNAKNPRKPHWADNALAHAVETLLAEHCPKCGVPIWWAYSTDNAVDFTEDEHKCYACIYADEQSKQRKDTGPGVEYTVRAKPAEGFDALPNRQDFYERMHEERLRELSRAAEAE